MRINKPFFDTALTVTALYFVSTSILLGSVLSIIFYTAATVVILAIIAITFSWIDDLINNNNRG